MEEFPSCLMAVDSSSGVVNPVHRLHPRDGEEGSGAALIVSSVVAALAVV